MTGWTLSKTLFVEILSDRITDSFLAQLVWERLGYQPTELSTDIWHASLLTPEYWSKTFPRAPEVIAHRKASVHLTRAIPKEHKQLLKKNLNFPGYRIGELYPRRTRRATAVNWLLAWMAANGEELFAAGPLPELFEPPVNPIQGHPGDPPIQ
tara:strand:+ start:1545 stop:2003 length:459 start_codon:yes stop_codon:yes gene_type:complete